jgi:hypothetical protein
VRDLARSLGHSAETWQQVGHVYEPYSGAFRANPYVIIGPPPQIVAASAPPPAPKEAVAVGPDGCLVEGSRADAVLRAWSVPIAAGRGAAAMPLLLVGQSLWSIVKKALRPLHAYPTAYDRISVSELPVDNQTLMAFRANTCRARIVMVSLPSVAAAAWYADGLRRLQDKLPQTSFAFFTTAEGADLDRLPAPVRERYATITWRDSHLPAVQPEAAPLDRGSVLGMVEASHKRAGGTVGLGISAGQRLGLEHLPHRDAALAAMHHEAAAAARRIAAMEGAVHDTKRVKLNDFHRGAGVLLHNSAHKTSFDP